ncbi:secretin receptor-like isoform X2 [Mytilus galloprovincialis]|uniref:secretin receptor-like isoform X2 n=1 Tax=Mytilus galloprovincialis TaxID=29158 RepID=UPI003F7C69BE
MITLFFLMETHMLNNTNQRLETVLQGKVFISPDDQEKAILRAHIDCLSQPSHRPHSSNDVYCNRTWDGILCWPETKADEEVILSCPDYIHEFYYNNNASKHCMSDGRWYIHNGLNKTWTNYTSCYNQRQQNQPTMVPTLVQQHLENIKIMYNVGYGISLVSLSLAVFVMVYFRRLHCPRNTVHVNLFISFILRSLVTIIRDNVLVQGLGLPGDVEQTPYDTVIFITNGTHWECKLLFTTFYYILSASYMWIFVEGLHLYILIMVSVFSERKCVRWYILLGWGLPTLSVFPWVGLRIKFENTLCWNTNPTPGYFWILRGPVVLSIVVNFFFFINILWSLNTKMRKALSRSARKNKYRRLAKSTLVLIPLFGIHYIVFIGVPDDIPAVAEVVKLYFEMFFSSFQGLVVAILFCFMNGEVQSEILKRVCRRRPYNHYLRYYRSARLASQEQNSCSDRAQSGIYDNFEIRSTGTVNDTNKNSSNTQSTDITPDNVPRNVRSRIFKWHIDSKGHLCRHYMKRNENKYCNLQINLRRAQSCL